MKDIEARIDAKIFKIFNVSSNSINLILDSLGKDSAAGISPIPETDLDEDYKNKVMKYL